MPIIDNFIEFNGFSARVARLGLNTLVDEIKDIIEGYQLNIEETKKANGTIFIRKSIDRGFEVRGGWKKSQSGNIDWVKSMNTGAALGVEIQVSGRSDMVAVDVLHLKKGFRLGVIDAGIIVVPSDDISPYLTDRAANLREAKRHIIENHFDDQPIALVSFRHDGTGPRLAKQRTRQGRI